MDKNDNEIEYTVWHCPMLWMFYFSQQNGNGRGYFMERLSVPIPFTPKMLEDENKIVHATFEIANFPRAPYIFKAVMAAEFTDKETEHLLLIQRNDVDTYIYDAYHRTCDAFIPDRMLEKLTFHKAFTFIKKFKK